MNYDERKAVIDRLEALEALYEIYEKYPQDKFVTERIGKISWYLSQELSETKNSTLDGFFELGEGASDDTLYEHYRTGIKKVLEELNGLRAIAKEEADLAHKAYIAESKDFSKEGYKIEAYYEHVADGKVIEGASVVIARDRISGTIVISTGNDEIRDRLYELFANHSKVDESSQTSMEQMAATLPSGIEHFTLQRRRVVDSRDWLAENGITTDLR